jgi:hypothetical protein
MSDQYEPEAMALLTAAFYDDLEAAQMVCSDLDRAEAIQLAWVVARWFTNSLRRSFGPDDALRLLERFAMQIAEDVET